MSFRQDKVTMTRNAEGIQIVAECMVNGKLTRETCRADTEHDLKLQFPKAHELHETLLTHTYGPDRRWWRQFAIKPEPATEPARQ